MKFCQSEVDFINLSPSPFVQLGHSDVSGKLFKKNSRFKELPGVTSFGFQVQLVSFLVLLKTRKQLHCMAF